MSRGQSQVVSQAQTGFVPGTIPGMKGGRKNLGAKSLCGFLDDRQITHLICARLKHLLMTFLGGGLGLLYKKNSRKEAQNAPKKVI